MIDTAQRTKLGTLLANDAYANIAAINAAAVALDTKDFYRERALVLIINEDAGADTTITVEHSNTTSSGDFAAVPTSALQNEVTAAAATLKNLNTAGVKAIALDLRQCRRYVRIQAATELNAATAVAAVLVGRYIDTPQS